MLSGSRPKPRLMALPHEVLNVRPSASTSIARQPVASTSKVTLQPPPCPACKAQRRMMSIGHHRPSPARLFNAGALDLHEAAKTMSMAGFQSRPSTTYAFDWRDVSIPGRPFTNQSGSPEESAIIVAQDEKPRPEEDLHRLLADFKRVIREENPHLAFNLLEEIDIKSAGRRIPIQRSELAMLVKALSNSYANKLGVDRSMMVNPQYLTEVAEDYCSKLEQINQYLKRRGESWTMGDYNRMLKTYAALDYAPGAIRVWSKFAKTRGWHSTQILRVMAAWIRHHTRALGEDVGRAVAEDLLPPALALFSASSGHYNGAVHPLLDIAIKANSFKTFDKIMRTVYGFDYHYPGIRVEGLKKPPIPMKKAEVRLVLDMLSRRQNLSSMITVYEYFYCPTTSSSQFFTSVDLRENEIPLTHNAPLDEWTPYMSLCLLIKTSNQVGAYHMARHYTKVLFTEWEKEQTEWMRQVEKAVSVVQVQAALTFHQVDKHSVNKDEESETTTDETTHDAAKLMPLALQKRYIPISLLRDIFQSSKAQEVPLAFVTFTYRLTQKVETLLESQKAKLELFISILSKLPRLQQNSSLDVVREEARQAQQTLTEYMMELKAALRKFIRPAMTVTVAEKSYKRARYSLNLHLRKHTNRGAKSIGDEHDRLKQSVARARVEWISAKISKNSFSGGSHPRSDLLKTMRTLNQKLRDAEGDLDQELSLTEGRNTQN